MGKDQRIKRYVLTAATLFLTASVLMLMAGLSITTQPVHRMFLILALAFFVSGAGQLIMWTVKKDLFKEKSWTRPDHADGQD